MSTYDERKVAAYIPVQKITAKNGITYAYRRLGPVDGLPVLVHTHLRAHMGWWDPVFIREIAAKRPVIMFDQPGVGQSSGNAESIPTDLKGWAEDAHHFLDALSLDKIDLVGYSIGAMVAQLIYLHKPERVRRLVLIGADPGAPLEEDNPWPRTWPPQEIFTPVIECETDQETMDAFGGVLFWNDPQGLAARYAYYDRVRHSEFNQNAHNGELPKMISREPLMRQVQALLNWFKPDKSHTFYQLGEFKLPVLIMNGDHDVMVPHARSWELLEGIPHAQLIILPHAGHGSIWQYARTEANYVNSFLESDPDDWASVDL